MKSPVVKTTLGLVLFGAVLLGPLNGAGRAQDLSTVLLQTVREGWHDLPPQERSRALQNYRRYQKLPPERRRSIEEKYHRWQQLPNEERERIRRNYKRYRGMNSDEKEEFSRKYKKWRSHKHD